MIAIVFPGQGSQKPGMGRELAEAFPAATAIYDRVSEATGLDLRALSWETDEETLRSTDRAQIALYTSSLASWAVLEHTLTPEQRANVFAAAGHSVGEYAALAAAGVISVEDGAKLVQQRGALMAVAGKDVPGTMAAVLNLTREELQAACDEVEGIVVIANDNCPGQLVISGEVDAVSKAGEAASKRGAKRVLPLSVSGAFHSPLMEKPAAELRTALDQATFKDGDLKVYGNVTSEVVADASEWPSLLEQQLKSPVRWTESIEHLIRDGVTTYIECGNGTILGGLIGRVDKSTVRLAVGDSASLAATVAALA